MLKIFKLSLASAFLFVLIACNKDDFRFPPIVIEELNLPEMPFDYVTVNLPAHLTTNVLQGPGQNAAVDNNNTPSDNTTTNEGATLGRVLFYDKNLSANGTISCASCHKQEH